MINIDTIKTQKPIWLQRSFFDLYCDAIRLTETIEAHEKTNPVLSNTLARAAMISNMFAIEAAASSVLECFSCSSYLQDSLDKLSTLDKFEFLLKIRNQTASFDRGRKEIQDIAGLIKLRNAYVHVKPKKAPVQINSSISNRADYEFEKEANAPITSFKIPLDYECWRVQHVQDSIKITAAFLFVFFIELSGLSAKEATRFLSSEMIMNEKQHDIMMEQEHIDRLKYARDRWQANMGFFNFNLPLRD